MKKVLITGGAGFVGSRVAHQFLEQNYEVYIYDSFKQSNPKGCGAVKSRSVAKSLSEWQSIGFRTINGNDLPKREDLEARLVAPDGTNGRMFLVYSNYKNILYYNCLDDQQKRILSFFPCG